MELFAPADSPASPPARSVPQTLVRPVAPREAPRSSASPPGVPLWLGVHVPALAGQSAAGAARMLQSLAMRAQRFTPRVSLAPPDGLLLEVRSSLHLFGGVEGLRRALAGECAPLSQTATLAFAPTPLAALAGARAGRPFEVLAAAQLTGSLAPLPLAVLRWPEELTGRLAGLGVRTIGQALRLPRAGFAQRFGAARLADLDRLTGRADDPRERFEAPVRFRRRRELPCESASHALLAAALRPLLDELGRFLAARQCGVLALEYRLWHRHAAPTCCVLRLGTPLADAAQLAQLLDERLRTLALPEPARACELRAALPVPRVLQSSGLWQPGERGGLAAASGVELIERLRARLGPEALETLALVSDHRPESAWRVVAPEAGVASDAGASQRQSLGAGHSARASGEGDQRCAVRPLWLLPRPRLLRERGGLPRWRGALCLEGEPERIETGWWDGQDVARDYYNARDAHGRRLWLFREREPPHRWFLQGVYG
jgi:protein ImuB